MKYKNYTLGHSEAYENQKHLLEMIKDLKEELDVDKVKRASSSYSPASSAKSGHAADRQLSWLPLHGHHLPKALHARGRYA